ncbi:MAG: helix-turn-helix domain-containing protein [Victivallaceae bacterium]|nr:helix-turn-helix domain-containing protein [Victivallaceae bacterium]
MKTKETKSKYQVPNLERALKIIEHRAGHPECSTMAEISRVLGYPNNSVFRIVSSLVSVIK